MKKDVKMKKAQMRVANQLERSGYRISFCAGILSIFFDVVADSIYSLAKDSGIYVKIAIDTITKDLLNAILHYQTNRKKEIWVLKKDGKSSSDPGTFLVFRFDGRRLIEHPENWPIEKVVSTPKKHQATPQK